MKMASLRNVEMLDNKASTSDFDKERVKIDTSPFKSVRAAVSLFGTKAHIRKSDFYEKQTALHPQEEWLKGREQLAIAENVKAKALHDPAEVRTSFEQTTDELKQTDASKTNLGGSTLTNFPTEVTMLPMPTYTEEKHVAWEKKLRVTEEKHLMALAELRQELVQLKQELLFTSKENDAIFKQAELALATAEDNAKIANDVATKIVGMNECLVSLKLDCMGANQASLLEVKQVHTQSLTSGSVNESQHSNQESELSHKIKCKLVSRVNEFERLKREMHSAKEGEVNVGSLTGKALANLKEVRSVIERASLPEESATSTVQSLSTELERLKEEINSAKEGEVKVASLAREALANLKELRLEIERTRMPEETDNSSGQSLSTESKMILKKECDNGGFLLKIMELLRTESQMVKNQIAGLMDLEANATAATGLLTEELMRTREEMKTEAEAKARAVESISGLSQALNQVKAEAAEAKAEVKALQRDASKYRIDVEQAKSAMENAESTWWSALQEADTVKPAETEAVDSIESLSINTHTARASDVQSGVEISVSQDEYDSLKRKVQEAEEAANVQVATAMALVESVKESKLEMEQKVAMLTEDLEKIKTATKLALHRAEIAEAAKLALEGDLKRLRGREQRRKEKEIAITAQQYYMRNVNNQFPASLTQLSQVEPLASVLNIKTTLEGSKTMERFAPQSKPPSNSLGHYLSKEKGSLKEVT